MRHPRIRDSGQKAPNSIRTFGVLFVPPLPPTRDDDDDDARRRRARDDDDDGRERERTKTLRCVALRCSHDDDGDRNDDVTEAEE